MEQLLGGLAHRHFGVADPVGVRRPASASAASRHEAAAQILDEGSKAGSAEGAAEQGAQNRQRLLYPVRLVDGLAGAIVARDEQYQERKCALAGSERSGEIRHGGDLRFSLFPASDFLPRKSIEKAGFQEGYGS